MYSFLQNWKSQYVPNKKENPERIMHSHNSKQNQVETWNIHQIK